jgi:hypothetical protein
LPAFGYDLILFGFALSAKSVTSGKATVKLLGNGNVAVSGEAKAERKASSNWEGRSISFVSTTDLLMLKLADSEPSEPQRALSVRMQIDHDDPRLKPAEVSGFLSGLVSGGLIAPDRLTRALAIYDSWQSAQLARGSKRAGGSISVALALPARALHAMIAFGDDIRAADAAMPPHPGTRQRLFALVIARLLAAGAIKQKTVEKEVKTAFSELSAGKPPQDLAAAIFALRAAHLRKPQGALNAHADSLASLRLVIRQALALTDMVMTMSALYRAIPSVAGDATGGSWTEQDFAHHEEKLSKSVMPWLKLNRRWLFWFDPDMHPVTTAFLRILSDFSRPKMDEQAVIETITDPSAIAMAETMVTITMIPAPNGVEEPDKAELV